MAYTKNPFLPKLRAKAVELVRCRGWGVREVARYLGVEPSTVSRWLAKAPAGSGRVFVIPTVSSRPHTHPAAISPELEERIVQIRKTSGRCAPVLRALLGREGITVSLSTIERVLRRRQLVRISSPWKKRHLSTERPVAAFPGALAQMDTIHVLQVPRKKERTYIYTLVDCFSRWAAVQAVGRIGAGPSVRVFLAARKTAPFPFSTIQSDHGSEFSSHFSQHLSVLGVAHRHSRVRQPNDNAHVERFNRTIQEECSEAFRKYRHLPERLNAELQDYIQFYNTQRLHLGLDCKTPMEAIGEVLRRS